METHSKALLSLSRQGKKKSGAVSQVSSNLRHIFLIE